MAESRRLAIVVRLGTCKGVECGRPAAAVRVVASATAEGCSLLGGALGVAASLASMSRVQTASLGAPSAWASVDCQSMGVQLDVVVTKEREMGKLIR